MGFVALFGFGVVIGLIIGYLIGINKRGNNTYIQSSN